MFLKNKKTYVSKEHMFLKNKYKHMFLKNKTKHMFIKNKNKHMFLKVTKE